MSADLFSRNGYEQTTVQQVADAADIAVGTLFLYVRDKSDLLLLIFTERLEQLIVDSASQLRSGRIRKSVLAYFGAFLELYEADSELSRHFWREFLAGKQESRDKVNVVAAAMIAALQERLALARQKSEVGEHVDPKMAALHLYALFHATISFHLVGCAPFHSSQKTLSALLDSFWKGLGKATTGS
ncbi:hypothetical protein ACPOL_2878 [Acidisarcina polymorpha]|uniref:HTH tetR-type domain-containing protein n=1 Tax=Acidisarcina polymorpha TaxID=2211140 RepID=A0A2Z5FZE6_9BACT|nr:TetR/AcrR family transcriptional regulator [Acidisarcina polymorpha]AXC12182.1 hypothetical protein ACPOL_2878 [Acidisarcina polymorpha]